MVGPLPVLTNGRLTIISNDPVLGQHACNLDVKINNPTAGSGFLLDCFGGVTLAWETAADEWADLMKLFYHTTTDVDDARLYKYVTGAYQAIDIHSTGKSGTLTDPNIPALEQTLTSRDDAFHLDKIVFLEGGGVVPLHGSGASLGAPYSTLADSLVSRVSPDVGRWYRSKSDQFIANTLFYTTTFNKRLRRKRGLV